MVLPVLYEDSDIIAIEKPFGIASIPERDRTKETVLSALETQLKQKVLIVHRLDKDVTGVMLFAKTVQGHKYLNDAFFNREVKKTYRALVHGVMQQEQGTIDLPIRLFGSGRMGVDDKKGKPSITEYECIAKNGLFTLVNAFPRSGRRHQIRVHLYSISHPIVGDPMYGNRELQKKHSRLMLHAEQIAFKGINGEEIIIRSIVPEGFSL
jgi:tRNA pseudouridine32 synthase/23S rRNA pseudouridine746 synthase